MQINQISAETYVKIKNKNRNQNLKNVQTKPSFGGWFSRLTGKSLKNCYARLDSDIRIYSPYELKKLKQNIALEIDEIIKLQGTPAVKKRLDDLLHSPFIDYDSKYINGYMSLADRISYAKPADKGTDTYRQFVLTSLSETMPLEFIAPQMKPEFVKRNGEIQYFLYNYKKMDENTQQAKAVRQMVSRLADANIPFENYRYFLADSLLHDKPLMSKIYIDKFNVKPYDYMNVYRNTGIKYNYIHTRKGNPEIFYDDVINTEFCLDDLQNNGYLPNGYMLFYQIAGLAKDKNTREVFDVFSYLKDMFSPPLGLRYKHHDFWKDTIKYHPELCTSEFLEKLGKHLLPKCENNAGYFLSNIPIPTEHVPKLIKDADKKIEQLKSLGISENNAELKFWTEFKNYFVKVYGKYLPPEN